MRVLLRNTGFLMVVGAAVLLAIFALRGPQGVPALLEKQRNIRTLEEDNADLARENEMKRRRIERLKTSRAEQELEIRKQLKLLRPGETQIILPETPGPEEGVTEPNRGTEQ